MGLVFLVSGCTLSLPDFGSEDNLELEPYSYKRVLDNNYDGYEDDDDISSAEIDEGAEDFAHGTTVPASIGFGALPSAPTGMLKLPPTMSERFLALLMSIPPL